MEHGSVGGGVVFSEKKELLAVSWEFLLFD